MRVLMFGAIGPYPKAFSRALSRALDARSVLLGCVVPRPVGAGIERWFRHRIIPMEVPGFACAVYTIGAYGEPRVYERLARLKPDLVVVAGFPRKLPASAVNRLGRYGALNAHPSLLPKDRGPAPAFWLLRRGDSQMGVTLHALTDVLDAGDVLARASTEVPFGGDGVRLLETLGALAGELVADRLPALAEPWHLVPQGDDVGPWAHKPKHADFEIGAHAWTCRGLFHFVRGARAFGTPWARLADDVYYFADALDFSEGRLMPGEFMVLGDKLMLKVSDGTVTLKLLG